MRGLRARRTASLGLAAAGLLLAAASAAATCSRPLQVPVAPLGMSVIVQGSEIRGVYPEWLQQVSTASRCHFEFVAVPRARLNQMFELGQADLMIPASRTQPRDALGSFVPLVRTRPALISLNERERAPLQTLGDLIARQELRVAIVRGFDFGDSYRQAVEIFLRQGRLVQEADPAGVGRALQRGLADVTIMTPSILVGTLELDERLRPLVPQLRLENVEEFPWHDSGVYLSRQRLSEADRRRLTTAFQRHSRAVWQFFTQIYPPGSLGGSIQPTR